MTCYISNENFITVTEISKLISFIISYRSLIIWAWLSTTWSVQCTTSILFSCHEKYILREYFLKVKQFTTTSKSCYSRLKETMQETSAARPYLKILNEPCRPWLNFLFDSERCHYSIIQQVFKCLPLLYSIFNSFWYQIYLTHCL